MSEPELLERPQVTAEWLSSNLNESSASGIASSVNKLIRSGSIATGSQLPTVRALASRMGVSPATVSGAWNILRKQRIIEGSGRQGTWVLNEPKRLIPPRYENTSRYWRGDVLDMRLAAPDPALLPDITQALSSCKSDPELNHYNRPDITPALREAVRSHWPWEPESWLAVNGGYEGLLLLTTSCIVPGDYVAVGDPSTPRILDILEHAGARVLPVATDNHGPRPDALRRAMTRQPAAFVYEPRSSSRLGLSVTPNRRDELAAVLASSKTLIFEDEGLGDLALSPYAGLGPIYPDRTVLIRSYSKSHGPDLRLAVLGGATEPITRASGIRQYGSGWTSRLLQNALAWMLNDPETRRTVETAKRKYAERRALMTELLASRGIVVENKDGLSLSVPVLSEQQALMALASHRIASVGSSEGAIRAVPPMVRLSLAMELDDPEEIADAYASAALAV